MRSALILATLSGALACGFTVHMLNSYRALATPLASTPQDPAFMEILRQHTGSVYAGSPYPDYLYECTAGGANHDDGEYTHWSPFQAAAVRYIRSAYPAPRNESGASLVAFIAGVTSHYMADISWHGLAETVGGYGFIETVGGMDFNDTGYLESAAHTESDTGAEFVAAFENSLGFDDPTQWLIPTQDLVNIYGTVNRSDVTAAPIEECAAIFFAGAEAVKAAAALAEPALTLSSPTLGESFSDLLVGGSDDMAVMVGRMWGRLAQWLQAGPPTPVPGHEYCSVQNPCASRPALARARAALRARQDAMRIVGQAVRRAGLVVEERVSGALLLRPAAASSPSALAALLTRELAARVAARAARTPEEAAAAAAAWQLRRQGGKEHGWQRHAAQPRAGSWTAAGPRDSTSPYLFYRAIRLLLGRAAAEAVARAAGYDAAGQRAQWGEGAGSPPPPPPAWHLPLAHFAPAAAAAPPSPPDHLAASTTPREYLGAAMAEGDFSGAGVRGLVFTAYGASPEGLYVDDALGVSQLGRSSAGAVLPQAGGFYTRSVGAARRRSGSAAAVGVEPILSQDRTTGSSVYARLGASACALDVNLDGVDDLVLGSPSAGWAWSHAPYNETPLFYYQGRVEVYFGVRGVGLPTLLATPSLVITPTTNQSFLGQALHCEVDISGDGKPDLIIGSPFWADPTQAAPAGAQKGRVDAFFASAATFAAGIAHLPVSSADFTALGGDQYEWLGQSLAAMPNASAFNVSAGEVLEAAVGAGGGGVHPACAALHAAAQAAAAAAPAAALILAGAPGARRWDGGDLGWASVGALRAYLLPAPATPAGRLHACQARSWREAGPAAPGAASPASPPLPPSPPYPLQPPPLFTILAPRSHRLGDMISTKLGAAVAVGQPLGSAAPPLLALAAPSLDLCNSSGLIPGAGPEVLPTSAGSVLLFPPSSALRGAVEWSALVDSLGTGAPFYTRALLGSAMPDSRFGWRLQFRAGLTGAGSNASAQDLLVSAPQFSKYFLAQPAAAAAPTPAPSPPGDSGRQAGAVLVFAGGPAFPAGFQCAAENLAAWRSEGIIEHGRLGEAWGVVSWEGDGSEALVVAAPRASMAVDAQTSAADYGGALQVYKLPLVA